MKNQKDKVVNQEDKEIKEDKVVNQEDRANKEKEKDCKTSIQKEMLISTDRESDDIEKSKRIFKGSKEISEESPPWKYLKQRGIDPKFARDSSNIREGVHPRLEKVYDEKEKKEKPIFPKDHCLVFPAITRKKEFKGIQKLFIKEMNGEIEKIGPISSKNLTNNYFVVTPKEVKDKTELYITEGPMKALQMAKMTGNISFGLFGATLVNGSFKVPSKFTKIYICMDADSSGEKAELKIQIALRGRHEVFVIKVPQIIHDKKGLDWMDIQDEVGSQKALKFFENAKETAKQKAEDVKQASADGPPMPYAVAKEVASILDESPEGRLLIYSNDNMWLKRDERNCYQSINKDQAQDIVLRILQNNNYHGKTHELKFVSNVLMNLRASLLREPRPLPFLKGYDGDVNELIFLENCIIKVHKDRVEIIDIPLNQQFTRGRLHAVYDPNKKDSKVIDLIKEILGNDPNKIMALKEYLGFCLTPKFLFHKFLVLVGLGRNGKGVIATIMEALFDKCTHLSLSDMNKGDNKFGVTNLFGSQVNFSKDEEFKKKDEGMLKMLTAGEKVMAEYKYEQGFDFQNFSKLVILSNKNPDFKDISDAIWFRLRLIKIEKQTLEANQNNDYVDVEYWRKDPDEMSALLNFAIAGRQSLLKNKKFIEIPENKRFIEEAKNNTIPAREYMLEHLEETGNLDDFVFSMDALKKCNDWLIERKFNPLNINQFHQILQATFRNAKDGRKRKGGKNPRGFSRIAFKSEIEMEPVQTNNIMNFAPSTKRVKEQERYEMPI